MDFFNFLKNNKLIILIISIIINVLVIILCIFIFFYNIDNECVCEESFVLSDSVDVTKQADNFYVEIKGAVKNPGVYLVNSENIINDIVKLAGGFTKKAYTKNINLSRKVTSELVIYVYTESEYKKNNKKEEQLVCECSSYEISNCTNNSISEILPSDKDTVFEEDNIKKEEETLSKKININTASKSELTSLTGIGDAKAEDIIEFRTKNGDFKNIDEIKNVSGIGEALFEKIKDNITV